VDDEGELERLAAPDRTDAAFELDFSDEVRRALAEVPSYNREVFLLHYIEGFSYEEIEHITGVRRSSSTGRSRGTRSVSTVRCERSDTRHPSRISPAGRVAHSFRHWHRRKAR